MTGGPNDTAPLKKRDTRRHVEFINKKYPGSKLNYDKDANLYHLVLLVEPATEFFIDVSLYAEVFEVRLSEFKETIRRLIRDSHRELTIQQKEEQFQSMQKDNNPIH